MANEGGPLAHPQFGPLPPPNPGFMADRVPWRYRDLMDEVRRHPNHWALIAVFEKGSPPVTRKRVMRTQAEIYFWLRTFCPTEAWEIAMRTDLQSWSRRELWARYRGVLGDEEMKILRKARQNVVAYSRAQGKKSQKEIVKRLLDMADPEKEAPHPWIR